MKDIETALKWAREYCEEYSKKGLFDPFAELTGTADRKQQIFGLCCDLLHNVEVLNDQFTADLKKLH